MRKFRLASMMLVGVAILLPASGCNRAVSALEDAKALAQQEKYAEAKRAFKKMVADYPDAPERGEAETWLSSWKECTTAHSKAASAWRTAIERLEGSPELEQARKVVSDAEENVEAQKKAARLRAQLLGGGYVGIGDAGDLGKPQGEKEALEAAQVELRKVEKKLDSAKSAVDKLGTEPKPGCWEGAQAVPSIPVTKTALDATDAVRTACGFLGAQRSQVEK